VVCLVVDAAGVVCSHRLVARRDGISAAIVGRHPAVELAVGEDAGISLRHLAIVVHPTRSTRPGDEPRFRVLDLRTATAMTDELGRRLESLEAEGPVFVQCESRALLLFPTTDADLPWPDDPEQGWACIPERVYFDEAPARPDRWVRRRDPRQHRALRARRPTPRGSDVGAVAAFRRDDVTAVQTCSAPALAQPRLLSEGEPAVGALRLRSPGDDTTIELGERVLALGVLLGRYDRCDSHGLPVLDNPRVSRVHLLLVQIGQAVYAIDTASTNGVVGVAGDGVAADGVAGDGVAGDARDAQRGRTFALQAGRDLLLPGQIRLSWKPR